MAMQTQAMTCSPGLVLAITQTQTLGPIDRYFTTANFIMVSVLTAPKPMMILFVLQKEMMRATSVLLLLVIREVERLVALPRVNRW